MKTVNVSELEGAALDWAISGLMSSKKWLNEKYERGLRASLYGYRPSTDWTQGGPLIEKYNVALTPLVGGRVSARCWDMIRCIDDVSAPTHLMAAMRAIVAAELGETVDIPEELFKK